MEATPNENVEQVDNPPIDSYWIVSNIFAIIALMEEKFGPQAVESIVAAATLIEESMRKESTEQE